MNEEIVEMLGAAPEQIPKIYLKRGLDTTLCFTFSKYVESGAAH